MSVTQRAADAGGDTRSWFRFVAELFRKSGFSGNMQTCVSAERSRYVVTWWGYHSLPFLE